MVFTLKNSCHNNKLLIARENNILWVIVFPPCVTMQTKLNLHLIFTSNLTMSITKRYFLYNNEISLKQMSKKHCLINFTYKIVLIINIDWFKIDKRIHFVQDCCISIVFVYNLTLAWRKYYFHVNFKLDNHTVFFGVM